MNSALLVLALTPGAEPPPDVAAAVAVAWAWKPHQAIDVPQPMPPAPPAADPRGEWSPWWDGRQWHPRWVQNGGSPTATPFSPPPQSGVVVWGSTPATTAPSAADPSTPFPATTGTAPTITLVPPGTPGGISQNCQAGQP